jgi:hypothetical protein
VCVTAVHAKRLRAVPGVAWRAIQRGNAGSASARTCISRSSLVTRKESGKSVSSIEQEDRAPQDLVGPQRLSQAFCPGSSLWISPSSVMTRSRMETGPLPLENLGSGCRARAARSANGHVVAWRGCLRASQRMARAAAAHSPPLRCARSHAYAPRLLLSVVPDDAPAWISREMSVVAATPAGV